MNWAKLSIFLALTLLLTSCSTSLHISSTPSGANFILTSIGITGKTDQSITVPGAYFDTGTHEYIYHSIDGYKITHVAPENNKYHPRINPAQPDVKKEILTVEKEGYRKKEIIVPIQKGENNAVSVILDKVDTQLTVTSTPAPIHLYFISDNHKDIYADDYNIREDLPLGWPEEFTTPLTLECSASEIVEKLEKNNVRLIKINDDGYIPVGRYRNLTTKTGHKMKLDPGKENLLNVSTKPIVTTLQVMSTPPGAIVEDISSGGFGYLGETPLIRNFNWEDVVEWSEKRQFRRDEAEAQGRLNEDRSGPDLSKRSGRLALEDFMLYLDLRISKAGHDEAYLKRLRLPVGEERSFHKALKKEIATVNFASDPAGVHVYVTRFTEKDIYDEKSGQLINKKIEYKKHLGTTPFTLNMDPNDPLIHGDKLIFKKTGYISEESMEYAYGNTNYYVVMEPVNIKKR